MKDDSTAVPYYFYNRDSKEWWIWKSEGVCTCYTAQINTAGIIFCPVHSLMHKINGMVTPMNGDS